jgi:hypothetical protein
LGDARARRETTKHGPWIYVYIYICIHGMMDYNGVYILCIYIYMCVCLFVTSKKYVDVIGI